MIGPSYRLPQGSQGGGLTDAGANPRGSFNLTRINSSRGGKGEAWNNGTAGFPLEQIKTSDYFVCGKRGSNTKNCVPHNA